MRKQLAAIWKRGREIFLKLSLLQRAFTIGALLLLGVGIYYTFSYSTQTQQAYLFKKPISLKDLGVISAELDRLGIAYKILEDKYVVVKDDATGILVRTQLAQNDLLPASIKGWELFDMDSWTTTEFDRTVKLRRALQGEMKRHIESLRWVESVSVSISVPEDSLYTDRASDVEAALTIMPAEGYRSYLEDAKIIKGIENLVARGIDGLARENIVITDPNGRQINVFPEEDFELQIKQAVEENHIKDIELKKIQKKIETTLYGVLPRDRFRVAVALELHFDKVSIKQKEILPVVIKKRTPNLPYDDSIVQESVKVSSKTLNENFEGLGFVPEGPAGQEPNLPPGYKESLDGRNIYTKDEEINNYVNGERLLDQKKDAMEIVRKSVSVTVDGLWKELRDLNGLQMIESNSIVREYTPVAEQDLRKFRNLVQASINYNSGRGDSVIVENIQFDRNAQFLAEDEVYLRRYRIRMVAIYSALGILSLLILVILVRWIQNTIIQRRIAREEEAELMKRLQRERALRDLDTAEIIEDPPSEEEIEASRLSDEIAKLIQENPKQTARVIATIMSEN